MPSSVATFLLIEIFLRLLHECSGMNDTYGIHHWRILWSSYRKLARVRFEPTTTEFRSDINYSRYINPSSGIDIFAPQFYVNFWPVSGILLVKFKDLLRTCWMTSFNNFISLANLFLSNYYFRYWGHCSYSNLIHFHKNVMLLLFTFAELLFTNL